MLKQDPLLGIGGQVGLHGKVDSEVDSKKVFGYILAKTENKIKCIFIVTFNLFNMNVYLLANYPQLFFDTENEVIVVPVNAWSNKTANIDKFSFLRFLKNKYTNKPRFVASFISEIRRQFEIDEFTMPDALDSLLKFFETNYDMVQPYGYKEAFELELETWKQIIFSSIRVSEMIKELGHKRIATAGRPVKHKQFSKSGEFLGYREYDVIFETHQVNGSALGLNDFIFAVKCWCTTTNNEHWLWIDREFRDDPLEAIARTFFIHKNLIPFVKELKRQGDILLVELTADVEPRGQMVSLSKDQYFDLLTAQS
jgi:hypothetical protein